MAASKPLVVGAFVLGAVGIGIVAILVFGGMKFFTRTTSVMVVFPDSVAGLDVGSPVTFRGVQIGRVKAIQIRIDVRRQINSIPVFLALEPARIMFVDYSTREDDTDLEEAVRRGLRAQLISRSYVTGELSVNLDFHRDLATVQPVLAGGVIEIPTIPSDLQNIKDQFRRLDLPALGEQARHTLVSLQHTLDQVSRTIEPLAGHVTVTLHDIDRLAIDGRVQLKSKGDEVDSLLLTAQRTTTEAETLLGTLNDLADPQSEMRGDLQASIRDLAATSSYLRGFTQDLSRSPIRTLMRAH